MNICYPDYKNCITNLACSILNEFGIDYGSGSSLKICDDLFKRNYKNIVVLLLDGMGKCIIENNLSKDGFFASHMVGTYSSVFPPTTVAATTSIDSGKNPVEHSWLGWDCYYKEIDKNILIELEKTVQELCNELKDTLVIVTADHGLIDSKGAALEDYPELLKCLVRMPSIEPRALNFFIKTGMEQQFVNIFNKESGSKFLLLTKEEVHKKKIFGDGTEHP